MRRAVIGLLVILVAACGAPNLDESVADESPTTIRARIVEHGDWEGQLSAEQLDQLAAFIAEYADSYEEGLTVTAPGLAIWKAHNCADCHVLAAGGSAD